MKAVVAVSGGVDSVVLLHKLVADSQYELVVAHFDHGMRNDSAADARFVQGLAQKYDLTFELKREELGINASEDMARQKRYEYLFELAEKYQARLVTAHHKDDVVETVALNLERGTRWRGLAVMSNYKIWRPLIKRTKSELINYALGERLEWVEDETNQQEKYSRNKLRKKLVRLPYVNKDKIYQLWRHQQELKQKIDTEIATADFPVESRYFVTMIGQDEACELLYKYFMDKFEISLLSGQLEKLWFAIKVGRPNTEWQIGQGLVVKLSLREWCAEMMI